MAELLDETRGEWCEWLSAYGARLKRDARDADERAREMRTTSPKYVPREWMLAQAYEAADRGDLSVLHELYALLTSPCDAHRPNPRHPSAARASRPPRRSASSARAQTARASQV